MKLTTTTAILLTIISIAGRSFAALSELKATEGTPSAAEPSTQPAESAPAASVSITPPPPPPVAAPASAPEGHLCTDDPSVYSRVTIGAGLPAASFRLSDGKIGILDKIAPAEVNLNFCRRKSGTDNLILWRVALGIVLQKPTDASGAEVGAYLTPWSMQYDKFAFGVAVGYTTTDTITFYKQNFSVLLPVSYSADW
jgi:hypothetical protein